MCCDDPVPEHIGRSVQVGDAAVRGLRERHHLCRRGCDERHDRYRRLQETDFGTHTIFIGRIVTCAVASKSPLLYHEGRFCRLEDMALHYA